MAQAQAISEISSPIITLSEALANAQAASRAVGKEATNTFHKYKYASADSIIAEAQACLGEFGVSILPLSATLEGSALPDQHPYMLRRKFLVMAGSESREMEIQWPVVPEKGRPIDKAVAVAHTTSFAYFLRDLLLIPRVDETDNMDHEPQDRARGKGRDRQPPALPREVPFDHPGDEQSQRSDLDPSDARPPYQRLIDEIKAWADGQDDAVVTEDALVGAACCLAKQADEAALKKLSAEAVDVMVSKMSKTPKARMMELIGAFFVTF